MNHDNYLFCNCGKKRGSINSTNWERYLNACKKRKNISSMSSIIKFFKSSTSTTSTSTLHKYQVIDNTTNDVNANLCEIEDGTSPINKSVVIKEVTTQQILNTNVNVDDNEVETPVDKNEYIDPGNHEVFPKDSIEMNHNTTNDVNANLCEIEDGTSPINKSVVFKEVTTQQILNINVNVDDNEVETPVDKNEYIDPGNHEVFPKDSIEMNLFEFGNDPSVLGQVYKINPDLIEYMFKNGPAQPVPYELPNKCFPKDSQGRSFHENWYYKKQPSGEIICRKWLSYSVKKNKIFCLYCALFGNHENKSWTREGFSNWKNGVAKIIIHETSEKHITASIKAMYKEASFPLLPSIIEQNRSNVVMNREIVSHLVDLTLFLGRHCLPFRGHKEGWQDELRGNFKDLALLLAKYSPALASYITEVQIRGKKTHNFLSWQRQNHLIQNTTFDISRKEQLSLVFRYINQTSGIVCERLVAVRETLLTTGDHLFTMFEKICKDMNLNWKEHLIGQAYDGAASMRGAYKGLQAIIKKENPRATYVWCWAHRFNLIIIDAVSTCVIARELFGNLETLYDFIGSSKKRVGFYSEYQKKRYPGKPLRRLKRVDTTRWSSHSSALDTVLETFDSIIDTLHFIQNDLTTDRVCCVKSSSLMNYMLSERFVLIALTFKKIFDITHPFTKFLQGTDIDLLDIVITQITERFNEDSTPLFKDLSLFQIKRLNEVAENESSLPIDAFDGLANVYGKFLNASDLRREFVQFAKSYSSFENITHLPESLHKHGFNSIDTFLETDTDTDDEYKAEKSKKSNNQKTINSIFKVCHSTGLKEVFPTIYTALRIALTLPVSSASPERAFSKLKLIKTRLRSTMCEERLESLMLISCEKDIAINTDDVIKTFSSYSSVLRKLLL
ncbi:zinc finger MYM-type protein 1-like [Acyrthosiphon pisum]|uniref:TTF-type domain-containing protein n=1 Tax=Acyrthosiphon pisum TaxID=7029 RepID=A0A8R2NVT3_ACYPI|nr:zinc finger MYM-type protein 1-like [Acyrthosiphon pisum]